jgi:very-short-patch-repair endonuclease
MVGSRSGFERESTSEVEILGAGALAIAGGSVDERIAAVAGAQRGQVARWQLRAAGVTEAAIGRRARSGHLIRRHPGVYSVGHLAEIPLGEETAALLACSRPRSPQVNTPALLSDHSAATLWELRAGRARPIHVTVSYRRQVGNPRDIVVHRSAILLQRDAGIHKGLPVTAPARTLLDIARRLPIRDVELALANGLARRLLTERDVIDVLRRGGGHPGRHALGAVVGQRASGSLTETAAEECLLTLIRQAQLARPRTQHHVLGYRADFAWPELRLIVEVDDYASHGTRAGLVRDRRRDVRLIQAGWTVLRFTNVQIEFEPHAVLAQVAHAVLSRMLTAG